MNVTVILPTYRRAEPLVWSMASVLLQKLDTDIRQARLVVINNDAEEAPVENAGKQALQKFGAGRWNVQYVHRKQTMDPVLSWYQGMRDHSSAGDIVFLHGDDDLMLPHSLMERVRLMELENTDLLLTQSQHGGFFSEDAARLLVSDKLSWVREEKVTAVERRISHFTHLGPAFIGNHCYRNTESFWLGWEACLRRFEQVPISGFQQRAMLPYLLPIDVARFGKVVGVEKSCVLRCVGLKEVLQARFGQANWKPGLLYAIALEILNQGDLAERADLNSWRQEMDVAFARWCAPSLVDKVSRDQLRPLAAVSPVLALKRYPWEFLQGLAVVLKSLVGLNGFLIKWRKYAQVTLDALPFKFEVAAATSTSS